MLAIVKSVRHWRPYLLGRTFTVRTDQRSLKYLMDQQITTPAQAHWLSKLLGYDYKIEYKPGLANQAADSLSRKAELAFLSVSQSQANWWAGLQRECAEDPFYGFLASLPHFVHRDGIWFLHGKVYLNPVSPLIPTLIAECHATPQGGHFRFHKTLARLRSDFRWPKMRHIIQDYIRQCEVCQQNKSDSMSPAGLLQPLPVRTRVWSDISMDFIEGLPPSHGYTTIMVVVDRLTKYAHFIGLSHPYTALLIAKTFISHIVRLHGIPTSIVSDRDRVFISSFWKALFQLSGTKLCMSSSYHPQSDGQTEAVNRILEQYLRCFAGSQPLRWQEWLPWAELSYNTSVHSSTKMSPFEAVYGMPPLPSLLMFLAQLKLQ